MTVQLSLVLPRDRQAVGAARRLTAAVLGQLGADETDIEAVVLALSEACTNAVEHARGDDTFTLTLACDTGSVRLTVTSPGVFDADAAPLEMPAPTALRGRGVPLMRALMDEFEVRVDGDHTVVSMCRQLRFPPDCVLVA